MRTKVALTLEEYLYGERSIWYQGNPKSQGSQSFIGNTTISAIA